MNNCRESHRGGGIIMFIKENIKFNVIKNEQFSKSHLIMINLNDLNIKITGFYRSPATKSEDFIDILENTLDKTDNIICFGDSNFDLFKKDDTVVKKYIQTLKNNHFNILNNVNDNQYTYSEDKKGNEHISILDLIFSDKFHSDNDYEIDIKDVCFSDHRLLLFKCNLLIKNEMQSKQKTIINFENISNELNSFDCMTYGFNDFMNNFIFTNLR